MAKQKKKTFIKDTKPLEIVYQMSTTPKNNFVTRTYFDPKY